jgi:hypothetical protein
MDRSYLLELLIAPTQTIQEPLSACENTQSAILVDAEWYIGRASYRAGRSWGHEARMKDSENKTSLYCLMQFTYSAPSFMQ